MHAYAAKSLRLVFALGLLAMSHAVARGETWTDSTGSFSVEASFVGVEGRSVVLRKLTGDLIQVPIDRLSDASRATAKRLYEEQKQALPNPPGGKANAVQAPYPLNGTLQQASDHLMQELHHGNFGVTYLILPKNFREFIDGQQMRDELAVTIKNNETIARSLEQVLDQLVTLVTTKKKFILNSSIKQSMPPFAYKELVANYDDLIGFFVACRDLVADRHSFASQLPSEFFQKHANRIGSHAKTFLFEVPNSDPEFRRAVKGRVVQNGDSGEILYTDPTRNTRWQLVDGYWVMEPFALLELTRGGDHSVSLEALRAFNAQQNEVAAFYMGMINGFASSVLQPMLEAKNQAQFDQAALRAGGVFSALDKLFDSPPD